MNKIIFAFTVLVSLLLSAAPCTAQKNNQERKQWFSEMRQLRTKYVVKELNLTADQREKFIPIYDAMSRETMKVMHDSEALYKSVKEKGKAATDLEKEKAAEALYECKGKENAIEMRYFAQFKSILTADQIFKLKKVENRFNRQLMKHRHGKKKK